MAKALYLSATEPHSGKTLLSVGLLLKFQKEGKKVGYFRPIARANARENDNIDDDARVIKQIIGSGVDFPSPVAIHNHMFTETVEALGTDQIKAKIKAAYEAIADNYDVLVIEGTRCSHQYYSVQLEDAAVAKLLGARLVFVNRVRSDVSVDELLALNTLAKAKDCDVAGVIFTDISRDMIDRTAQLYVPLVEPQLPVLGQVPEVPELVAPTVAEVFEAMGGQILEQGSQEKMDSLVEDFLIGAMNFASALKYLKRGTNLAMITGGDRSDLLLSSIESDVSCLIVTGNLRPNPQIIAAAREKGIPVLMVAVNTYSAATRLEKIKPQIQVEEQDTCLRVVEDHVDFTKITEFL